VGMVFAAIQNPLFNLSLGGSLTKWAECWVQPIAPEFVKTYLDQNNYIDRIKGRHAAIYETIDN
jgi:hypothetical protein